jgi:polysaccharide export outer membrane protein
MHISSMIQIGNFRFLRIALVLVAALVLLGFAGCAAMDPNDPFSNNVADTGNSDTNAVGELARLNVGDIVTITMVGPPEEQTPLEKPITDDGTIQLPDVGRIQAAGKTPGELEQAIHDHYVPAIYTHLSVTVKITGDRVYFVRGEVKTPGRLVYDGPITVTKAITSAGDFTDYANHHEVYLTRANGKRFELDCDSILKGEEPDPPVFPGDQIEVKRRWF